MNILKNTLLIVSLLSANVLAYSQNLVNLFVGSYGTVAEEGIKWYQFNEDTGEYSYISGVTGVQNASFQTLSPDGKRLYSVSENAAYQGQLVSYDIDYDAHKLTEISRDLTLGDDPCHVWVDGSNALAATANYSGGSVTFFAVDGNGKVVRDTVLQYEGGYPDNARQNQAHLHFIYSSPDGRFVFADDLGNDKIYRFAVDGGKVDYAHQQTFAVAQCVGPRHAVFHTNGKYLYVIGELSGTIEVFDYDSADGNLTFKQSLRIDPLYASGSGDIRISPDGRYLYGSNRLKGDGIAIMGVDAATGTIANVGYQPTGTHPRNFNITPNGKFLLCACRDTNSIQIFARDIADGTLTLTGTIATPRPVALIFK
jgi:6-phosphogluconolactonase (cycloisomerase 2 family)